MRLIRVFGMRFTRGIISASNREHAVNEVRQDKIIDALCDIGYPLFQNTGTVRPSFDVLNSKRDLQDYFYFLHSDLLTPFGSSEPTTGAGSVSKRTFSSPS